MALGREAHFLFMLYDSQASSSAFVLLSQYFCRTAASAAAFASGFVRGVHSVLSTHKARAVLSCGQHHPARTTLIVHGAVIATWDCLADLQQGIPLLPSLLGEETQDWSSLTHRHF